MSVKKHKLDPEDLDIILCESLIDENDNFYDLNFKTALEEQLNNESLLYCEYETQETIYGKRLISFLGYTETKVIFHIIGFGVQDILLHYVLRNPPNE